MRAMAGVGQAGHDRGQDRLELNRASGLVAILTHSFASYFHLSQRWPHQDGKLGCTKGSA